MAGDTAHLKYMMKMAVRMIKGGKGARPVLDPFYLTDTGHRQYSVLSPEEGTGWESLVSHSAALSDR